jgi:nucleotide-binding universal stress UspA family protein
MTVTRGYGDETAHPSAGRQERNSGAAGRPVLVVGVDGSAVAGAAVEWATVQARRTGARVVAVAVCEPRPVVAVAPAVAGPVVMPGRLEDEQLAAEAERWLAEAISPLPVDAGHVVERQVAHGDAATTLLDTARDADLLVLGNHRRGALTGALLGSVAQHCVRHASCPVVLVPAPEPSGSGDDH